MTTDDKIPTEELVKAMRAWYIALINSGRMKALALDILAAANSLEEQEKVIQRYEQANAFLAAHGWEWKEDTDAEKED